MARAEIEDLVRDFARPDSAEASAPRISEEQLERALETARLRYGEDRPLRRSGRVLVAADGLALEAPEDWTSEARALSAEIHGERLCLEGEALRLARPRRPGEEVRLQWRRPARLTAEVDEIPPADREALAALAASILLHQVAVVEASNFDEHMGGGAVGSNPGRSEIYKRRAAELEARYQTLTRAEDSPGGASVTLNFGASAERRARRIYHGAAL